MAEKDKKPNDINDKTFSLIECELNKRSIFNLKPVKVQNNPQVHDSGKINMKKHDNDEDKIWIYDNGKLI